MATVLARTLVLLASALVASGAGGVGAAPTRLAATVASITDGDTLRLTSGARVRLLQIDAPELGTGECYSRAARTELLQRVPVGSRILLETDPGLDRIDRFGRLLRYVRRGTMNVNVALVRAGAAAPYFFEGDRGRYAAPLLAEATRAKAAKRGLWRACPRTMLDPYRAIETGGSAPPQRLAGGDRCDPSALGRALRRPVGVAGCRAGACP